MQVAALESALGKEWSRHTAESAARSAAQSAHQAVSGASTSTLKDLLVVRDVGILHGVPAETQRAVLLKFQLASNKHFQRIENKSAYVFAPKVSARKWLQCIHRVAIKLPESDGQKLWKAMARMSPPMCAPHHRPGPNPSGLIAQWAFVMKLSAVEGFWSIHRRCPEARGSQAVEPGEALLGQALMCWRSKAKAGTLDKVRCNAQPRFSVELLHAWRRIAVLTTAMCIHFSAISACCNCAYTLYQRVITNPRIPMMESTLNIVRYFAPENDVNLLRQQPVVQ